MKYNNLLRFLLFWVGEDRFMKDLIRKENYEETMAASDITKEYKEELKEARKEYLEYLTDPEYHGASHD